MTNRQIEDVAVQLVLDREKAGRRGAADTRSRSALADIKGDLLIEVKAVGGTARGSDLWLETKQVQAALDDPERFTSLSQTTSSPERRASLTSTESH